MRALKDLYFEKTGPGSFAILDFPKLKTPLQFMRDQLIAGGDSKAAAAAAAAFDDKRKQDVKRFDTVQKHFMSHTRDMIKTSLSVLPASVPLSAALACFKVVLAVTTVPITSSRAAKDLAPDVTRAINTVVRYADLRDEIYLQVIKQLNDNPRHDLTRQAWRLLDLLLEFVPPSTNFENFLESFVRSMGADDTRLFRLYNILSKAGIGEEGGETAGAVGVGVGVGGGSGGVQYVSEKEVESKFRVIFKL